MQREKAATLELQLERKIRNPTWNQAGKGGRILAALGRGDFGEKNKNTVEAIAKREPGDIRKRGAKDAVVGGRWNAGVFAR